MQHIVQGVQAIVFHPSSLIWGTALYAGCIDIGTQALQLKLLPNKKKELRDAEAFGEPKSPSDDPQRLGSGCSRHCACCSRCASESPPGPLAKRLLVCLCA